MINQDLAKIANFLDKKFSILGFRFGWDGILGFIPGVGDIVTNLLSIYILIRGAMNGAPPIIILRMGLNILLDNLFDSIPILGNFFDFFWKSNLKNIVLLEQYSLNPEKTHKKTRWKMFFALAIAVGFLILSVCITIFVVLKVIQFLREFLVTQTVPSL